MIVVVRQDFILEFIYAGLGIGYTLVDLTKIKYPELKELSINKEIPRVDIILATNKGINLTFAAKKFLNNLNSDLY
jgi:hypothetical protein